MVIGMDAPSPAPGVRVFGGRGGTKARLTDLDTGAGALRHAAHRLDEAEVVVHQLTIALWRTATTSGPDGLTRIGVPTATRASSALQGLLSGPSGLLALADRLRSIARDLDRARAGYEEAESRGGRALRGLFAFYGSLWGNSPQGALVAGALALPLVKIAAVRFALTGDPLPPGMVEPVLGGIGAFAGSLAPGWQLPSTNPVPGVAGAMRGLSGAGSRAPHAVAVHRRLGERTVGPRPRTLRDLVVGIKPLYPSSGGPAGTIAITRIGEKDGPAAWVVSIPGTQEWTAGTSANPFDLDSNLALMRGTGEADSTKAVLEAMRQAAIPADEPVVLAGHSQGGLIAGAVVSSSGFLSRYKVAAVATAGSPMGTRHLPAGVTAIHLENLTDAVTKADARPNPDTPSRTTVQRDLRRSSDPRDLVAVHDLSAAHDLGTYGRTAEAAEATPSVSIAAWTEAAGAVLDHAGPGVTELYTATRVPVTVPSPGAQPPIAAPA